MYGCGDGRFPRLGPTTGGELPMGEFEFISRVYGGFDRGPGGLYKGYIRLMFSPRHLPAMYPKPLSPEKQPGRCSCRKQWASLTQSSKKIGERRLHLWSTAFPVKIPSLPCSCRQEGLLQSSVPLCGCVRHQSCAPRTQSSGARGVFRTHVLRVSREQGKRIPI